MRSERRREYQIAPKVVVTIASGIPGNAHRGEIHGAKRLRTNGAATALKTLPTNTAATHTSYRRTAGGSGSTGSVGFEDTGNCTPFHSATAHQKPWSEIIKPETAGRENCKSPQHLAPDRPRICIAVGG